MKTAPTPEPAYWDEVHRHNRRLYEQSPRQSILPGITLAGSLWEDPRDLNKLTHWRGVWLAGSLCVRTQLITVTGTMEIRDDGVRTSLSEAHHFQYKSWPLLGPTLAEQTHVYQFRSDDRWTVDKAVSQGRASEPLQRRAGFTEPEPADYELYLEELRRGATGDFTVSLIPGD